MPGQALGLPQMPNAPAELNRSQWWRCGMLPVLLFLTSALAGFALLSAVVRVAIAFLRATGPVEAVRLVLLNPTMLAAVVAWTVGVLLAAFVYQRKPDPHHPRHRCFAVAAGLLGLLLPLLAGVVLVAGGGERIIAILDLPLARISPALGVPTLPPDIHMVECRGKGICSHIDINAHGFRSADFSLDPPADRRRILTVGDSFVFGSGVEAGDTLAAQLQEALSRERSAKDFDVLNLGIPGFSFHASVRLLQALAPKLRPEWVVIGFLRRNDLEPVDTWERIESVGMTLWVAAALLHVDLDWFRMEAARESDWQKITDDSLLPGPLLERFRSDLAHLQALQAQVGFGVVVFSYDGDFSLLAPAAGPEFLVLAPAWLDQKNPAFSIPGDGHPTATANRSYGQAIAAALDAARAPDTRRSLR